MANPIIDQLAAASTPEEVQSILDDAGVKLPTGKNKIEGDAPPPGEPIPGDIGDEAETPAEAATPGEEMDEVSAGSMVGTPPASGGPTKPPAKKKEPSLRELKDKAAEKAMKGMG